MKDLIDLNNRIHTFLIKIQEGSDTATEEIENIEILQKALNRMSSEVQKLKNKTEQ